MYSRVAVKSPFNKSILTYAQGDHVLKRGAFVKVPLGKQLIDGCVLEHDLGRNQVVSEVDLDKIREIKEITDCGFILSDKEIELYHWLSKYYHYNLGQLIFDTVPKFLKRPRALTEIVGKGRDLPFTLNDLQQGAVDRIRAKMALGFSKWLIHGITGSGKTAIYLSIIKDVLGQGKSVLFLLPEINLTPQFLESFGEHVPAKIYSYNSSISASDKFGLWRHLKSDDSPKVIIGVRSSIFLPIQKLGLIVVDEEHDSSFKQDDRCPYNARDIALKRGRILETPVILGSATPSIETYHNFIRDNSYITLFERVGIGKLPTIELLDDTEERDDYWPLNSKSISEIKSALQKEEQVLVFVNRLGFANYLQCSGCGHQFFCPNCSVNLRYYKKRDEISCNCCDYKDKAPDVCPECQNMNLLQKGFGTERLQEVLEGAFPENVIKRFDRDEITTFKKLEERLEEFHRGDIDVLVGTQMLSKGHNFRRVNLVVVAGIDSQLNFPDFRATERVYQLLTQVAGRSGRFGDNSKVIVHTFNPDNSVFKQVQDNQIEEFYSREIEIRELCKCPPYSKIVMIYITSRFYNDTVKTASDIAGMLKVLREKHFTDVEVIGPRPGIIEKRVNKFSWAIMIRSENINQLHNMLNTLDDEVKLDHRCQVKVDVDPSLFL